VRRAMGQWSSAIRSGYEVAERRELSAAVNRALHATLVERRILVVAPDVVPVDMVTDPDGRTWGEHCAISHIPTGTAPLSDVLLRRAVRARRRALGTYALVCPMAMDRNVARHLQDIVTVALSLESRMPVELWLQPSLHRALQSFRARHLSWLHIDTHGGSDGRSIMLGPSREGGAWLAADAIPARVGVPLVVACGCVLNAGSEAIGATLLRRGVRTVFGPCTTFESLGIANSEEGEAAWYRAFFMSLIDGHDVGTSLLRARQQTPGGALEFGWVLLGSSLLGFGAAASTA
jgi:hypothetical protein